MRSVHSLHARGARTSATGEGLEESKGILSRKRHWKKKKYEPRKLKKLKMREEKMIT